ncbi:MAG TPA: hypothetical protein DD723_04005 [Candidatus Omnitrophica bacterium]|nr:MAG: hypothetical protein A2Z81_00295 [Omnitrophica WOR_2 bacterium GWA2_45_18]OGX19632.1 MAG: hypothetical protein A2Y04_02840 [Omnitrophica WOR_2 bacterium GWC2_45_7]HBR14694.1 hypothetical protein [Candidatus Omnitrophota bacterium]
MINKFKCQTQFELFPGALKNSQDQENPRSLFKNLTLSPENIIVLVILFVMALVLFFSFGVERGKTIVKTDSALMEDNLNVYNAQPVAIDVNPLQTEGQKTFSSREKLVGANEIKANTEVISVKTQKNEVKPLQEETLKAQEIFGNGEFTIQVASFKLENRAQEEAKKLKEKMGQETFVLSKGKYSIVCIGKFAQKDSAQKLFNKLKKKYNDCLVRRF